jgi:hypothetical protein
MDDDWFESNVLVCPYCGEEVEPAMEQSAGVDSYYEDCPVCCRPWRVIVLRTDEGRSLVQLQRADD